MSRSARRRSGENRPTPLPRNIAVRLADVRPRLEALRYAMDTFGAAFPAEAFESAATGGDDPEKLTYVHAVERGFELLEGYIIDLAAAGLQLAGLQEPEVQVSGPETLRRLQAAGVISGERCRRLIGLRRTRNLIVHEYPEVRARLVHEAVEQLVVELPGFLRDYDTWLRRLGYGAPAGEVS